MIKGVAREAVLQFLPSDILSFGYPEGLEHDLSDSELTVVDLPEFDLNDSQLFGQHTLVIDPGTFEHVANVSTALRTAIQCVARHGHIVQVVPITMQNHGYWSYTPQLLCDIYHLNGFQLKTFQFYTLHEDKPVMFSMERNTNPQPEVWSLIVAQRLEIKPWKWPIQEFYSR